jgi:hypothetical protein
MPKGPGFMPTSNTSTFLPPASSTFCSEPETCKYSEIALLPHSCELQAWWNYGMQFFEVLYNSGKDNKQER